MRQIVRRFRDTNRTPGVMVGIWSPRGTFVTATGVADLGTGKRLNANMQFKIASHTKTLTANLILQLVGERKIFLGDHIRPSSQTASADPARSDATSNEARRHRWFVIAK